MQKINFNDRYGLTQAVIEGRKTNTRRIEGGTKFEEMARCADQIFYNEDTGLIDFMYEGIDIFSHEPRYKVGEIVAVAQRYQDIFDYSNCVNPYAWEDDDKPSGWTNKMFTKAELMPHRIRIIGIKCERLRDISDEDCIKEGIFVNEYVGKRKKCHHYWFDVVFNEAAGWFARGWYNTPREAFAMLIDKVCGRGTWGLNPWVVVYEFELVK